MAVSSGICPSPHPQHWDYMCASPLQAFLRGCWGWNSVLHARSHEQSPQLLWTFLPLQTSCIPGRRFAVKNLGLAWPPPVLTCSCPLPCPGGLTLKPCFRMSTRKRTDFSSLHPALQKSASGLSASLLICNPFAQPPSTRSILPSEMAQER